MKLYQKLIQHYEDCLLKYGDTPKGLDWPNEADMFLRYKIMLEVIREKSASILDFGCGTARMYSYILKYKNNITYTGLDISEKFLDYGRRKYPKVSFFCRDVLIDGVDDLPKPDYIILNGVFTEKRELSFAEMEKYFQCVLQKIFPLARRGIAFNVMAKAVDWEREDLFHMPTDQLISFLVKNISRHFVIRNDYGLYEYTVYVYKNSIKELQE